MSLGPQNNSPQESGSAPSEPNLTPKLPELSNILDAEVREGQLRAQALKIISSIGVDPAVLFQGQDKPIISSQLERYAEYEHVVPFVGFIGHEIGSAIGRRFIAGFVFPESLEAVEYVECSAPVPIVAIMRAFNLSYQCRRHREGEFSDLVKMLKVTDPTHNEALDRSLCQNVEAEILHETIYEPLRFSPGVRELLKLGMAVDCAELVINLESGLLVDFPESTGVRSEASLLTLSWSLVRVEAQDLIGRLELGTATQEDCMSALQAIQTAALIYNGINQKVSTVVGSALEKLDLSEECQPVRDFLLYLDDVKVGLEKLKGVSDGVPVLAGLQERGKLQPQHLRQDYVGIFESFLKIGPGLVRCCEMLYQVSGHQFEAKNLKRGQQFYELAQFFEGALRDMNLQIRERLGVYFYH